MKEYAQKQNSAQPNTCPTGNSDRPVATRVEDKNGVDRRGLPDCGLSTRTGTDKRAIDIRWNRTTF